MLRLFTILSLIYLLTDATAQNQKPVITNFQAVHNNDGRITFFYDLSDTENDEIEVSLHVSDNAGRTYSINTSSATGAIGFPVMSGTAKEISWEYNGIIEPGSYRAMLVADDRQTIDIAELVAAVDSNRLRQNLEMLHAIRHRTANPQHLANVQDSLESRMQLHCDWAGRQSFDFQNYVAHNMLGKLSGAAVSDSLYIIDAHYDSVDDSPGADDNASGVAGFLEAMRVLAPCTFRHDIQFIGFDLEEAGLVGSNRYVNNGGLLSTEQLGGVFNFEMIGYLDTTPNSQTLPFGFETLFPDAYAEVESQQFRGNFITNVGNVNSSNLVDAFDNAAAQYVPDLRVVSLLADGSGLTPPDLLRSDHAPFWFSNKKALMLTDGAEFRNPNYHSPNDKVEQLDFQFMQQVVQATVAAVAQLAQPIHASKAFAPFDLQVGTQSVDCTLQSYYLSSTQQLHITEGDCFSGNINWKLYSISGQLVQQGDWISDVHQNLAIPLPDLATGLYILELRSQKERQVLKVWVD